MYVWYIYERDSLGLSGIQDWSFRLLDRPSEMNILGVCEYHPNKGHEFNIVVIADSSTIADKIVHNIFTAGEDSSMVIFYHEILQKDVYLAIDDRVNRYDCIHTDSGVIDLRLIYEGKQKYLLDE